MTNKDTRLDGVEARWRELDRFAETRHPDSEEQAFHIGARDGFEEAVQLIDTLTGGDGEYRLVINDDPERHCPDPARMIRNIVERSTAPPPSVSEEKES